MLRVEALTKRFPVHADPAQRLRDIVLRRAPERVMHALDQVSFRVADGETLGIIGRNGAGKSTLLKLLAGTLLPDAGTIARNGRVAGLLELGIGFDPELTGRENALLSAMLLGLSRAEATARLPDMLAFSELGDFLDVALKLYSSGMAMRLAFAVAYHVEPACFLIDEALAVGDAHFQQKCMRRITEFKAAGGTIVFVAHDMNAIKRLCDRVLVMEQGRVWFDGPPEAAVNSYNALIAGRGEIPAGALDDGDTAARPADAEDAGGIASVSVGGAGDLAARGYGTRDAVLVEVRARVPHDGEPDVFGSEAGAAAPAAARVGDWLQVDLRVKAARSLEEVTVGVVLRDASGQDVFGLNSYHAGTPVRSAGGPGGCWVRFACQLVLAPGTYRIGAAVHGDQDHLGVCYHWVDDVAAVTVRETEPGAFRGLCRLPAQAQVQGA